MGKENLAALATAQVRRLVLAALQEATKAGKLPQAEPPDFVVETPADTAHGDFASNIALVGARTYRMKPQQIATVVTEYLDVTGTYLEKVEIAGPGFLNFFLNAQWFADVVAAVKELGTQWGKTDYGQGRRVLVEFVSANPTGPMHLGNARGGVIGDSLAAALNTAGFAADREFYLNDAGNQIEKFGLSLELRYLQLLGQEIEFPEDCYQGEDITQRAQEYINLYGAMLADLPAGERQKALIQFALPLNIAQMHDTLKKYRIVYDTWFSEQQLYKDHTVEDMLVRLEHYGYTYKKDGAIWYKATAFGAEKDEVLVRQNGNPTYFAGDIAYHYNKFVVRGYEHGIDIWGADHHGHVARLKGAMNAVGLDGDRLDVVLMQLVRLMKDGEPFRMSKRSGKSVTLNDLLDMVSVDAARFFFNMRESGSAMDFDLDLAVKQSSENPVFYVQYAHARICSLNRKAAEMGIAAGGDFSLLEHSSELGLIRTIAAYPNVVIGVAKNYNTASLTHYALEVSAAYHKFYSDCRILPEDQTNVPPLTRARLALANAAGTTLRNLLGLLNITAPESM